VAHVRRAEITGSNIDALVYFRHLLLGKMHAKGIVNTNTESML